MNFEEFHVVLALNTSDDFDGNSHSHRYINSAMHPAKRFCAYAQNVGGAYVFPLKMKLDATVTYAIRVTIRAFNESEL